MSEFYLLRSGKLIPLLLVTSPRLFGYAAAFAPVTANSSSIPATFNSRRLLHHESTGSNMADEVAAAKTAAEEYNSSENDGAGPATVFDNILSGKWPSDKVHEDDLSLAFRE